MTSANARTDSQPAPLAHIRRAPLADLPRADVGKVVKRVVAKCPAAPIVDVAKFGSAI